MTTHAQIDILGGPVRVRITGVTYDSGLTLGWWRVGGRKLQVRCEGDLWVLTGAGFDAEPRRFSLPTSKVRRQFRMWARRRWRPGKTAHTYVLDGRGGCCVWGWDDVDRWLWHDEVADLGGSLHGRAAKSWLRDQLRTIGVRMSENDAKISGATR